MSESEKHLKQEKVCVNKDISDVILVSDAKTYAGIYHKEELDKKIQALRGLRMTGINKFTSLERQEEIRNYNRGINKAIETLKA